MPRREGVIEFYHFYERILTKVKIKKLGHLTLSEFARNSRKYTRAYIYSEGGFAALTDIYSKSYYGYASVSDKEWQLFVDAYDEIYENIYDEVGKWRYMLLFYLI